MPLRYIIQNCTQPTTAAPVKQPTGTAIRTMLQVRPALSVNAVLVGFGVSFDASAAATPGQVELFETTVAATMSTACAAGDIMPFTYLSTANTAGATGVPFNLSTTTSGFATAAVTEGTVAGYRLAWAGLVAPTNQFDYQFPLGREFDITPQMYLRLRVTFAASVNMQCYVVVEI
jgi:2-methylcitrate dehydratase PrpD